MAPKLEHLLDPSCYSIAYPPSSELSTIPHPHWHYVVATLATLLSQALPFSLSRPTTQDPCRRLH